MVSAKEKEEAYTNPGDMAETKRAGDFVESEQCGVFGDPTKDEYFAFYLQKALDIMQFLAPVLVIIMTILDLIKITSEQKQDGELKKLGFKTLKRFIYAVLVMFVPSIINIVFPLIGLYGSCGLN